MEDEKHMIELAVAQFIGFVQGRHYDLTSMVDSMGLTKDEWEQIKQGEPIQLTESERNEVDEYFQ